MWIRARNLSNRATFWSIAVCLLPKARALASFIRLLSDNFRYKQWQEACQRIDKHWILFPSYSICPRALFSSFLTFFGSLLLQVNLRTTVWSSLWLPSSFLAGTQQRLFHQRRSCPTHCLDSSIAKSCYGHLCAAAEDTFAMNDATQKGPCLTNGKIMSRCTSHEPTKKKSFNDVRICIFICYAGISNRGFQHD